MKTIEKFKSFEELKSSNYKSIKLKASAIKKHKDFERVLLELRAIKVSREIERFPEL